MTRPAWAEGDHAEWWDALPAKVKEATIAFPPGIYHRRDIPDRKYWLVSYEEMLDGSITVTAESRHPALPGILDRTVFGIPLTDLVPIKTVADA